MPILGILAEPGSPPGFVALVAALGAWCRPQGAGGPAVAWLASSPAAAACAGSGPVAVWVDDPAPSVIVTAGKEADGQLPFPHPSLDLRAYPPMAPVIRGRWRTKLGLPDRMVVDISDVPAELAPTALALTAAVIATGARLAEAMAWAAPCVTDAASAAALGADGDHVAIGSFADLRVLAEAVADDDAWAATLSAGGRRLAERRLDRHGAARRVAGALGLLASTSPTQRVLDDLRTPAASLVRRRVDALVAL